MSNLINKMDSIIDLLNKEMINAEEAAMRQLIAKYTERIFNRGSATDESRIGNYSTKTMFTGSKNFRTQTAANKFFKSKPEFRKVKTPTGNRALAIVKGGYSEFRTLNGLQNAFVDLEFRGDLFRSIQVGELNGHFVLGYNSLIQAKKMHNLEIHFKKKIAEPTIEEKAQAEQAARDYLQDKLQNLFNTW